MENVENNSEHIVTIVRHPCKVHITPMSREEEIAMYKRLDREYEEWEQSQNNPTTSNETKSP